MNWSLLMSSHNLTAACLLVCLVVLSLDLSQQGDILSIIIQICYGTICFLEPNKELIELKHPGSSLHSLGLMQTHWLGLTKLSGFLTFLLVKLVIFRITFEFALSFLGWYQRFKFNLAILHYFLISYDIFRQDTKISFIFKALLNNFPSKSIILVDNIMQWCR